MYTWKRIFLSGSKDRAEEEFLRLERSGYNVQLRMENGGKFGIYQYMKDQPPSEMKGWFW